MVTPWYCTTDSLPNKPSELIKLALKELEVCERSPGVHVDMSNWWYDDTDVGQCYVCLAGAVMRNVLGEKSFCPGDIDHSNLSPDTQRLLALNRFRIGMILTGIHLMGYSTNDYPTLVNVDVCMYKNNPTMFKDQIGYIINQLEAVGL